MLKPRKSLGQNFLQDDNILRKIVDNLELQDDDLVLEIGPGQGALTKYLCERPVKLIGVEIDERAVHLLKDRFGGKLEIIHSSVLDVDLNELAKCYKRKIRIVGNIPYYLTSEILFWLFEANETIIDAALMMQLEVARRLVAPPKNKEYGILSVFTQFFTDCELLFKVSRNSFFPKPDVDSAVVKLNFKMQLPDVDRNLFRSVVRSTFGKRRKTLRNGLKSLSYNDNVLSSVSFDLDKRPEMLSVEEFVLLTQELNEIANRN
jgi:16S rRNA (adenine1518-N6/adenine1519-N6)-dimethyltransferase